MKKLFLILFLITNIWGAEEVFQELLLKVKQGYKIQTKEDRKREQRFLNDVAKQQNMIKEIKKEIAQAKNLSKKLKKTIGGNEEKLQKLTNKLELSTGDFGELFGTVKQISSDLNVHIKNSLVSSQYPQRVEFLNTLNSKQELPDIKELEKLWYIILQEIVESGKIVKYDTPVIWENSLQENKQIVRIGNFNTVAKDGFLQYDPSNRLFVKPTYQPDLGYRSDVNSYINSEEKIAQTVIDPTRGAILEMYSQKPTLEQRLKQGGAVGYIIIFLAFTGILFALGKYIWLSFVHYRVKKQLKNTTGSKLDNPLGRIIDTYEKNRLLPVGDLEYKVDESFYKEIPPLQSGFSMIKLFAATTPLLGLLGTVTGMILTFQSITMFGTNDPKLMAGGISQALITTMLGLIAAIPLLFAHALLNSKAKKVINILEQNAMALIARKMG